VTAIGVHSFFIDFCSPDHPHNVMKIG
jgi:hypothetical protein